MTPEKDPSSLSWLIYAWMIGLSILGGLVNFAGRASRHQTTWRDYAGLATELLTSIFVGILTFWLCEWRDFPPLLTAALVGVSAHMGTRAIFQLELVRNRILGVPKEERAFR